MLDRLYAKLPHAGRMRLLDQVLAWDDRAIECATSSHRCAHNPLRGESGLSAAHAVEYAAQAAAVHGVLCGALDGGPVLLLAAVSGLELLRSRLDDLPDPLRIGAELDTRVGANARYRFVVGAEDRTSVRGAITLMSGGPEWQ